MSATVSRSPSSKRRRPANGERQPAAVSPLMVERSSMRLKQSSRGQLSNDRGEVVSAEGSEDCPTKESVVKSDPEPGEQLSRPEGALVSFSEFGDLTASGGAVVSGSSYTCAQCCKVFPAAYRWVFCKYSTGICIIRVLIGVDFLRKVKTIELL
jgi:hypothetical protein